MKVTAQATRSGQWWALSVPEVPGAYSQVRRLDQAGPMVADAVALMLGIAPGELDVTVVPHLPEPLRTDVAEATQANTEAAHAQATASKAMREAVRQARASGLTVRDVAELLKVSPQRISQLSRS